MTLDERITEQCTHPTEWGDAIRLLRVCQKHIRELEQQPCRCMVDTNGDELQCFVCQNHCYKQREALKLAREALREAYCWLPGHGVTPAKMGARCETLTDALAEISKALGEQ